MEYSAVTKPTQVTWGGRTKWMSFTLYVLSLAIALFLLYINFVELFWFPIGGIHRNRHILIKTSANNIINALQLVAKGYEILVVACLGVIALEVFKRHLIKDGVPFGLLTGAYRVTDVMFLLKWRFWMMAPCAVWLSALLVGTALLGTLVGPASAILIVPKLGLFAFPNAFSNVMMPLYMPLNSTTIWPKTLSNETVGPNSEGCLTPESLFTPLCPTGGYSIIFGWAWGWTFSELPNYINFPDPSGTVSRRLDIYDNLLEGTFFSSLTALEVSTLGQFKTYIKSNNVGEASKTEDFKLSLSSSSQNLQPLVNVKCTVWNRADYDTVLDIPVLAFPYKELKCFEDEDCIRMRDQIKGWQLPKEIWSLPELTAGFHAINQSGETGRSSNVSSLLLYAFLPYDSKGKKSSRAVACSYMAHWIPSTFWANSTDAGHVTTNLTNLTVFAGEEEWIYNRKNASVKSTISIDKSWLSYLSYDKIPLLYSNAPPAIPITSFLTVEYLLNSMQFFSSNESDPVSYFEPGSAANNSKDGDGEVRKIIEKLTGSIVTDAIARTCADNSPLIAYRNAADGYIHITSLQWRDDDVKSEGIVFSNHTWRDEVGQFHPYKGLPENFLKENGSVVVDFEAERYGYGYGKGEGSMVFAIVVICLYVAVSLLYWAVTLYRKTNTIAALGDLQDLVALAWKSRIPVELEERGVNDVDKSMWKEHIVVRATSSGAVTMALDKNGQQMQLSELRKGEEYW